MPAKPTVTAEVRAYMSAISKLQTGVPKSFTAADRRRRAERLAVARRKRWTPARRKAYGVKMAAFWAARRAAKASQSTAR